jgi:anti-sigma-K factor RskA
MTTLTCDELRAMAAEVALGILSGAERADALGHMEHCVGCRVLVEGLAQTGDSLLLLAPEAEPPLGFESGVAARVTGQDARLEGTAGPEYRPAAHVAGPEVRPEGPAEPERRLEGTDRPGDRLEGTARRARTRRWRTTVAAAAAAAVLVGGTAAAVTVIDHHSSGPAQVADQTTLRSGHFRAGDGRPVGQVYAYSSNPSWVFMNVDASGANGTFTCELELANGSTVPVGQFDVHDGIGEWAHTVGVDVNRVKSAKLVTPSGLTLATAAIS